jgi:hypothetical protein
MEKLEKRIRELVPSLQELSFGCEFKIYTEPVERLAYIKSYGDGYNTVCTVRKNGDVYTVLRPRSEIESWEILGHPIQLQDVMMAIEKKNDHFEKGWSISIDGFFIKDGEMLPIWWDLGKPLNGQSEEVITFLNELL